MESVIWLNGFQLMMMMMMTIYFTEATRLLESRGSAVSVPQEEEQQYKMSNEKVQCAMAFGVHGPDYKLMATL